jgi:hypothetical protein
VRGLSELRVAVLPLEYRTDQSVIAAHPERDKALRRVPGSSEKSLAHTQRQRTTQVDDATLAPASVGEVDDHCVDASICPRPVRWTIASEADVAAGRSRHGPLM